MAYVINGPVNLGSTSTATQIFGNVSLVDNSINATTGSLIQSNGSILVPFTTPKSVVYFDANGAAQTLAASRGSIIVFGVNDVPAVLAPGTSGYVLTAAGSNADVSWASVPPAPGSVDESCFLFKSGTQTIGPGASTATITSFTASPSTPEYNTSSMNATTGIFTVVNAGKFRIVASITYNNNGASQTDGATAGTRILKLVRNGTAYARVEKETSMDNTQNDTLLLEATSYLNSGDTIAIQFQSVNIGSGAACEIQGNPQSWISIHRQ